MEKKKMKIWKKILIVIEIILLIFVIRTARNMIIIKMLDSRVSKYQDSTNYHITTYEYQGEIVNISQTYRKDDKYVEERNANHGGHKRKLTNYCNGATINTYIEIDEKKFADLNSNGLPFSGEIINYFETENLWQFIVTSATAKIKSEVCNGKKCYKINNLYLLGTVLISGDGSDSGVSDFSTYIEKDTGLMIRFFNGTVGEGNDKINIVTDYKYEFDTVTDEDFKEPDVNEYQVKEN